MKRFIYFLFIAVLAAGCGEDNSTEAPENKNLNISGTFTNWSYKDTLKLTISDLRGKNPYLLASTPVAADGSFNLEAPVPSPDKLLPITEIYYAPSYHLTNVVISDSTAKFFLGKLVLTYQNIFQGYVDWTDVRSINQSVVPWKYYTAMYFYFDKNVNIKGSAQRSDGDLSKVVFNFSAKAGWNILLLGRTNDQIMSYEDYKPINGNYVPWMFTTGPLTPIHSDSLIYTENP